MTLTKTRFLIVERITQRPKCGSPLETETWRPPILGSLGRVDCLLPSGDVVTAWIVIDETADAEVYQEAKRA